MAGKIKLCINASNLHVGGAIQVAVSFFKEICNLKTLLDKYEVKIILSSVVASNLGDYFNNLSSFFSVEVFNIKGLEAFKPSFRKSLADYDVVFTLFGPDYLFAIKAKRVVGFAQAWIIYPTNDAYSFLPIFTRFKMRFNFFIKKQFFKGATVYVVELEHVKDGLVALGIANYDNVYIAYNAVSNLYHENIKICNKSKPLEIFKLGLISRSYSHKNLEIIPQVIFLLKSKFIKKVEFFVTLNQDEFDSHSIEFRNMVTNTGPKDIDQCIDFYTRLDGVFFPSLIESFSISPLEALATGCALFASDRQFCHDICKEFAYYFDPLDANDAAQVISNYIEKEWGNDLQKRMLGRRHALSFSSPRSRAIKYIEAIDRAALYI